MSVGDNAMTLLFKAAKSSLKPSQADVNLPDIVIIALDPKYVDTIRFIEGTSYLTGVDLTDFIDLIADTAIDESAVVSFIFEYIEVIEANLVANSEYGAKNGLFYFMSFVRHLRQIVNRHRLYVKGVLPYQVEYSHQSTLYLRNHRPETIGL